MAEVRKMPAMIAATSRSGHALVVPHTEPIRPAEKLYVLFCFLTECGRSAQVIKHRE